MLYGSECVAINKADIQRIDAVDQWCVRRILDIRWHNFVRNADIRCITNQPPLSSIIKSRCLTFFGHLARMDEIADASQAIFEPPPENWRRPPGRPRTTWMKNIYDDLSLICSVVFFCLCKNFSRLFYLTFCSILYMKNLHSHKNSVRKIYYIRLKGGIDITRKKITRKKQT